MKRPLKDPLRRFKQQLEARFEDVDKHVPKMVPLEVFGSPESILDMDTGWGHSGVVCSEGRAHIFGRAYDMSLSSGVVDGL